MAKNRCKYPVGKTEINGYEVEIIRYIGAQQISETNRKAACFWGKITTPECEEILSPESGWGCKDIDRIVGNTERMTYNRGGSTGESSKVRELKKMLAMNEKFGFDTTAISAEIEKQVAEDEANREAKAKMTAENRAKISSLKKSLRELTKIFNKNREFGFDTIAIESKMDEIKAELLELGVEI